jgi:hypothetical protein
VHDWQQSAAEAEHVVKALTVENQIVVDPFMGSGTIEIEIDKERFEIPMTNIHNITNRTKTRNELS